MSFDYVFAVIRIATKLCTSSLRGVKPDECTTRADSRFPAF